MLTLIILIAIGALGCYISKRPDDFRITRTIIISASPQTIFEEVNNQQKWQAWSPWAKLDPNAETSYQGPAEGVGATMRWRGNNKIGEGRSEIITSQPYELLKFRLSFLRPMKATNIAEFTFTPQGNQTLITWSMYGQNNFAAKAINLVINCEKMVGGQFENGLQSLKNIAERRN